MERLVLYLRSKKGSFGASKLTTLAITSHDTSIQLSARARIFQRGRASRGKGASQFIVVKKIEDLLMKLGKLKK